MMKLKIHRGRLAWTIVAAVLLLGVGLVVTEVYSASITVSAQPLQNSGAGGKLKFKANWSAAGSAGGSPSFTATGDATVDQKKPTSNYGANSTLLVKALTNKAMRVLAQFDVSTIPAGSSVTTATLTLCATGVPGSTRTYEVHQVTSTWAEGTVTWGTAPTFNGTATASAACMTWRP